MREAERAAGSVRAQFVAAPHLRPGGFRSPLSQRLLVHVVSSYFYGSRSTLRAGRPGSHAFVLCVFPGCGLPRNRCLIAAVVLR